MNDDLSKNDAPTYLQQKTAQAGWALMLGSMGFWALVLVVPFLPYSNGARVTAVTTFTGVTTFKYARNPRNRSPPLLRIWRHMSGSRYRA